MRKHKVYLPPKIIECLHCGEHCKCVRPAVDKDDVVERERAEAVADFFRQGGLMKDLHTVTDRFKENPRT